MRRLAVGSIAALLALSAGLAATLAVGRAETTRLSLPTGEGTRPFHWSCPVLADEATTRANADKAHRELLAAVDTSTRAMAEAMHAAMQSTHDPGRMESAFRAAEATAASALEATSQSIEDRSGCRFLGH